MKCFVFLAVIAIFFGLPSVQVTNIHAQSTHTTFNLSDRIPVDPEIKIGQFENGLRYYIKVNKKPEKRAVLRLVVNAGSVLEDDDQQGLAHLLEHMAFNGTKHFKKHELINYLESIGMKFGPEINAYTSFDETVYMLHVPTDSIPIMKTAFQILEDWAHLLSLEGEEIDKERGVVIEEWRLGRGAFARMRDKQFPIIFTGSQYAKRMVIGKKKILENFEHQVLRRLYQDWYRPDLQAIVAVGDFDPVVIEKMIKKHFAKIPVRENPRKRTVFPVPEHDETLFAIASDPEATRSSVSVYYKNELETNQTVADFRRQLLENLYNGMLNQRLEELIRQANPPYLYGYSGKGRFVRSKGVYFLGTGVKDNGVTAGLEAILTEATRVKKHGFTQSELDRMKQEQSRRIERAFKEKGKTESRRHASELVRNFLVDEPIPGIKYEFEFYKHFLPGVTLKEINDLAGKWITSNNRVIVVDTPEKAEIKPVKEADLLAVFEKVNQKKIEPYVDEVSDQPLVVTLPKLAKIIKKKKFEELGVTEWELANGVRIVLKPTEFKNDEVRFRSFSPGGNSLVSDENYIAAITATGIINQSGIGNFNQTELQKLLSGKVVRVYPGIGELTEGISGNASLQDLETMFQLIYLNFTAPRKDTTAFQSYQNRMKAYITNRSASPETAFRDTVQVTLAQYHHRARPWTAELLNEMDLRKSFNIYRDRFADASDFTFFFVGNFTLEKIKPLVQTYLGGLPSLNRKEAWKDVGMNPPRGVIKKVAKRGIEPKGKMELVFSGDYDWNRQNNYDFQAMISVLRIKLREIIREDLGGTYGVRINASRSHFPKEDYQIRISFGCDPKRIDELTQAVFVQIDSLQKFGIKEKYISKVKENQLREFEIDLKDNRFWLNNLNSYYYHKLDLLDLLKYEALVEQLSVKAVQNAAKKYFNTNNYVLVNLLPQTSEE